MDLIVSLIDIPKIFSLPWQVLAPGIVLVVLFALRAFRSIFTLSPIRAFTSVMWVIAILIILSNGGDAIVQLAGIETTMPADNQ